MAANGALGLFKYKLNGYTDDSNRLLNVRVSACHRYMTATVSMLV